MRLDLATHAYAIRVGLEWFGGFGGAPGQSATTKLRGQLCNAKLLISPEKAQDYVKRLMLRGYIGTVVIVEVKPERKERA